MKKIINESEMLEQALGVGGDAEIVPVLIPMITYRMMMEKAAQEGKIVADVIADAFYQYLKPAPIQAVESVGQPTTRSVDIVIKRRKL